MSAYPQLSVKYEGGADPTLVMKTTDGQEENISINSWKTEHIEEFLTQKLKK